MTSSNRSDLISRTPGWPLTACTAAFCALLVLGASAPGGDLLPVAIGVSGAGALTLLWFVRLILWWHASADDKGVRGFLRQSSVPLMVLVTAAVVATNIPIQARWFMSRGAFEAFAPTVPVGGGQTQSVAKRWVGLYEVTSTRRVNRDIVLTVNSGNFGEAGFAYMGAGLRMEEMPGGPGTVAVQSLGDGWYSWEWSGD